MTTRRACLALLVAAGLAWTGGVQPVSAQGKDVVVFAAASLQNALDEIARQWHRETGKKAVISYAASQRTHEIGIRLALGAQPLQILKMILRQGFIIVGAGVLAGILAAAGSRRI